MCIRMKTFRTVSELYKTNGLLMNYRLIFTSHKTRKLNVQKTSGLRWIRCKKLPGRYAAARPPPPPGHILRMDGQRNRGKTHRVWRTRVARTTNVLSRRPSRVSRAPKLILRCVVIIVVGRVYSVVYFVKFTTVTYYIHRAGPDKTYARLMGSGVVGRWQWR